MTPPVQIAGQRVFHNSRSGKLDTGPACRRPAILAQSKTVFKAARQRAGLHALPERRASVQRLTVEEELRFLDQAYAQGGHTGLMLQTLLETGARTSELIQLRVEDVSLAERVIAIRQGEGGKHREIPIRRDLAQLLRQPQRCSAGSIS